MNNTLSQYASFLIFVYGGILLGIVSCLLALLRARFPSRGFCSFCDAVLAGSFFFITAVCFFVATRGVLRLYAFPGLVAGFFLAKIGFGGLLQALLPTDDRNKLSEN